MTVLIISDKEDYMGNCAYCSNYDELRPYGRNGAKICFDCGMKPENEKTTEAEFLQILNPGNVRPEQKN